jgi:hypothetical protein
VSKTKSCSCGCPIEIHHNLGGCPNCECPKSIAGIEELTDEQVDHILETTPPASPESVARVREMFIMKTVAWFLENNPSRETVQEKFGELFDAGYDAHTPSR